MLLYSVDIYKNNHQRFTKKEEEKKNYETELPPHPPPKVCLISKTYVTTCLQLFI